jgi:hypothetical protein
MKKITLLTLLTLSLNAAGSVDVKSCINSIQVTKADKVSTMEKTTIKAAKDCFKDLKTAEKMRQKEIKKAARAEKMKKSLLDKLTKLQEKLKSLN